jgi:putative transcriptional regulator
MYREIEIDRINLTIMGVKFPSLEALESTANAIGSNMFEGFEPSIELVQLYVDWKTGSVSELHFLNTLHEKSGGQTVTAC